MYDADEEEDVEFTDEAPPDRDCEVCNDEVLYADEPEAEEEAVKDITVTIRDRTFSFTKSQAIGLLLVDAAITAAGVIMIFSLFVK